MKLKILVIMTVVLSLLASSYAAITYDDQYYQRNLGNVLSGGSTDPIKNFINETEGYLEGATAFPSLYFNPTDTVPTASEGMLYYSDADKGLKLRTKTAWVDVDVSGASSLATAYGIGCKIILTDAKKAVEIECTDDVVSAGPVLLLDNDEDTDNIAVLQITDAGAGICIDIDGTTGDDIQGTSDNWAIDYAGYGTFVGLLVGAEDLELENGAEIQNVVDTEIRFIEDNGVADEDIIFDFGTNMITLKSGTSVDELAMGAVDDLTGVGTIVFDAAASTVTLTGNADEEDLTISQATDGDNASLILQSSGTGTDALSLISSVADTKINSADNIDIDAADNITINTADGSYTLTIAGSANGDYSMTAADEASFVSVGALTIQNTEAESDITVNSVLGSIYIEAEEDAANAILITADGDTASTMKLHNDTGTSVTEAASSIELLSDAGGVELRSASNLAKSIALTSDGGTTGSIWIYNDQGASVTEGAASIELLSDAGGIELRSTANLANAISLTNDGGTTGTIQIYNDQGASTTEKAASVQLLSDAGSIELWSGLNGADAINIMADGDTASGITIFNDTGNGDESIVLLSDVGGITVHASAGSVDIEAVGGDAGDIILNSGDDMTLTVAGDLTLGVTGSTILPNDVLLKATVEVDADEADNLAATQIELVAAPGATSFIEFVSAVIALDYGATAWTESEDNLAIRYTDGSGVIVSEAIEATGFADATADTVLFVSPLADGTSSIVAKTACVNKALVLDNTGNGEWGNSGDSIIQVVIYYRIHTVAELGM